MNQEETVKIGGAGALIRFIILVLIFVGIIMVVVFSAPKNEDLSGIWDERTILGNKDAKNHYVMTTDIMCP